MLTGLPPWSELNHQMRILAAIASCEKPPTYPGHISCELADFLDKCFFVDPIKRANCYELLRHPFIVGSTSKKVFDIPRKNISADFNQD
jgi:serine/threonine protein kinase